MSDPQESSLDARVVVLGIPWDRSSSFLAGAAEAPSRIRSAIEAGSTNWWTENGIDLAQPRQLGWLDDLDLSGVADAKAPIEAAAGAVLSQGVRLLALGGDHSVTHPLVRAHAACHAELSILHFDAHPDLYDSFEGNRDSNACPFARIMEEGLVSRLVQVGIRTMNDHQRQQAERFGVEVQEMREWRTDWRPRFSTPVYVTVDLDALDPAFAPGVSHHEPGGLSVRDIIDVITDLEVPVIGADVVELNPRRDHHDMTAMVAVKLLKELAGKMLES